MRDENLAIASYQKEQSRSVERYEFHRNDDLIRNIRMRAEEAIISNTVDEQDADALELCAEYEILRDLALRDDAWIHDHIKQQE